MVTLGLYRGIPQTLTKVRSTRSGFFINWCKLYPNKNLGHLILRPIERRLWGGSSHFEERFTAPNRLRKGQGIGRNSEICVWYRKKSLDCHLHSYFLHELQPSPNPGLNTKFEHNHSHDDDVTALSTHCSACFCSHLRLGQLWHGSNGIHLPLFAKVPKWQLVLAWIRLNRIQVSLLHSQFGLDFNIYCSRISRSCPLRDSGLNSQERKWKSLQLD